MDIGDELRRATLCCCAANTFAQGNANTGGASDKRAQHQLSIDHPVKTRPIEVGQEIPHQRSNIGHIGNSVCLAVNERCGRLCQLCVTIGLAEVRIGFEIIHPTHLSQSPIAARPRSAYSSLL